MIADTLLQVHEIVQAESEALLKSIPAGRLTLRDPLINQILSTVDKLQLASKIINEEIKRECDIIQTFVDFDDGFH
jgi:hypothetical protein